MSKFRQINIKHVKLAGVILAIAIIAILIILNIVSRSFDATLMNGDYAEEHIKELSSETYQGRLAGSRENTQALLYIKDHFESNGIQGGGDKGSYFQEFSTIIPHIDESPVFQIPNHNTNTYKELIMYQDYVALPSFDGGGVDYNGDLLLVGTNLLRIDPALLEGKMAVIEGDVINPKWINYVKNNKGLGIICCADANLYGGNNLYERQKSINIQGKTGESIFVSYLSKERYRDLIDLVGGEISKDMTNPSVVEDVKIKVAVDYPIVETSNIMGIIEGRGESDRVLMITANIDGLGSGMNQAYFPGANNHTSGLAGMMELARVLSVQESLPYKSIVFVGFNASQQQNSGARYYINNPIYPLDKTTVVHLESIGQESIEGITISSDNIISKILKDKVFNYAIDAEVFVKQGNINGDTSGAFVNEGVPALMIHDGSEQLNTYDDTIDKISKNTMLNVLSIVINYIQRDVYRVNTIDYLSNTEFLTLSLLVFLIIFNIVFDLLYKRYPTKIIFGQSIELHYYKLVFVLIRKILMVTVPIIIVSFMLAFLVNINQNADIQYINQEWTSNFSFYLTLKRSIVNLRSMFDFNIHQGYTVGNIFEVIYTSSLLSIKLISASLGLSAFIGIIRGMYEGYHAKKGGIRSLGTLVFFSIPDVLIVLLGVITYTFIAKNFAYIKDSLPLKEFIFPLITLSIIPTVYVSRITYLTILEELNKEYVRAAKALGYSKIKIFRAEILPAVIFKVVDSLPTIMTMLLSNMIIVEYLFNYNGIVYYLLYLYKRQDVYRFVPMALTLGLIYSGFVYGIGLITKMINPLKRGARR